MSISVRPIDDSSDAEVEAVEALVAASDDEFLGGHDERTADQVRAARPDTVWRRMRLFVAEDAAADIIGVTYVRLSLQKDTDSALFWSVVSPAHRGRGVGTQLAEHAADYARGLGRPRLRMSAMVPADCDPADPALPSNKIAARLGMVGCGVDVARAAPLPLGDELLASLQPSLTPAPGYTLTSWRDRTPGEYLHDMVDLVNEMQADVPLEDKQVSRDVFTAERLRQAEQSAVESGYGSRVVAAVAPDGRLAGYTEVGANTAPGTTIAWQGDTVVAREHRGHGLGLTMKLTSHLNLGDTGLSSIATWNSQANPPMIAINEALGYRVKALDLAYRSA